MTLVMWVFLKTGMCSFIVVTGELPSSYMLMHPSYTPYSVTYRSTHHLTVQVSEKEVNHLLCLWVTR